MKAYSYIRFSTPGQEEGDSLRRQIEQSEAYCQAHGLTLDATLRLTDRGLSAFHGTHRTKGALGEFHRLVEQGEIEPGSVLLVESLDRLSREQVLDALTQFTGLIRAGVKVVTLADRMEYDRESINGNFGQLLMSLVIMSRAHEESAIKSFRSKEVWEKKRAEANNGHKLTANCPAWLKLSQDRKAFEVLPEVAQVVNWIFRMKLEGKGSGAMERILNAEQDIWKPNGKRRSCGGWRRSYIDKILRNRAVIGEYQPHRKTGDKWTPEGDPIPDYFPAIVDREMFSQVQAVIRHNRESRGNAGGRNGPINNLFGHIARCAYCGGPIAYVSKGRPPKGHNYLVCDRGRRGLGCKRSHIRYDKFEPLILSYCKGLDPAEILPGDKKMQSELTTLKNQLQAVEEEIAQIQAGIEKLLDNLELGDIVADRLRARQEQKTDLEAQREALSQRITKLSGNGKETKKQLESIQELIDRMAKLKGHERTDLRLNLRSQLRRLIDQMNLLTDDDQVGMIFKTGERRLLIMEGDQVRFLDVAAGAERVPAQLWKKALNYI